MTFEDDFYELIDNAYQFVDDNIFNEGQKKMVLEPMKQKDTPMYVNKLVVPHMYVKNHINYDRRDIPVPRGLGTTAKKMQGDCTDQSVILSSFYETFGVGTRLVSIDTAAGGYPHMIVEVKSTEDAEKTISELQEHYQKYSSLNAWSLDIQPSESVSDGAWFPVDPTASQYIGDIRPLVSNGYIKKDTPTQNSLSSWSYTNHLLTENISSLDLSKDQSKWGAAREGDYSLKRDESNKSPTTNNTVTRRRKSNSKKINSDGYILTQIKNILPPIGDRYKDKVILAAVGGLMGAIVGYLIIPIFGLTFLNPIRAWLVIFFAIVTFLASE